jgi:hypothetical protein
MDGIQEAIAGHDEVNMLQSTVKPSILTLTPMTTMCPNITKS